MDEYITRNNAISAVCFGCNQEFFDEPCELSECTIRQSIMALPTADVVPKSEVDQLNKELDELAEEHSNLIVEKDQLFDIAEKQKIEIDSLKIANEKMYAANKKAIAEIERMDSIIDGGEEFCNKCHAKYAERIRTTENEIAREVLQEFITILRKNYVTVPIFKKPLEEIAKEIEKKYTEEKQ